MPLCDKALLAAGKCCEKHVSYEDFGGDTAREITEGAIVHRGVAGRKGVVIIKGEISFRGIIELSN